MFRPLCLLLFALFLAPALAVIAEEPETDSQKKLEDGFQKTVTTTTGELLQAYSRRGDAHFFLGEFKESVADYERMVELNPNLDTSHWRRGIAYFYAGDYKKAARQFEVYHTFDNIDRENGIWRFLSQTKAYGLKKAREGLLKYEKEDREPFPSVYKLFAGEITPDEILKQIAAAKISDQDREARLLYAHLYIGLNHAVQDQPAEAKKHLKLAAENKWGPTASFGPNYMWHVGRVHFNLLNKPAAKPKLKE